MIYLPEEKSDQQRSNEDMYIRHVDNRPRCDKCRSPFDPGSSKGGHLGRCQDCSDD